MHWNKDHNLKKGYIALYTLIICSLCMIMVFYSFYIEVKKSRNVSSQNGYIIKSKKYDEYKEYAFTLFHKRIMEYVENLNMNNVEQYLKANNITTKIDNGKACIKYDSSINKIIFETYYDEDFYRRDLYEYNLIGNKLKYIYLNTTYIKGRIE